MNWRNFRQFLISHFGIPWVSSRKWPLPEIKPRLQSLIDFDVLLQRCEEPFKRRFFHSLRTECLSLISALLSLLLHWGENHSIVTTDAEIVENTRKGTSSQTFLDELYTFLLDVKLRCSVNHTPPTQPQLPVPQYS